MIAYLDTNVVVWLAQGNLARISRKVHRLLEHAELLVSPMVLVELEYLHEANRILLSSRDVMLKLEHEIGIRVCDLSFPEVVSVATGEKWTHDPFDRMIVAQAKANGLANLVSADEEIRSHYPKTIW